MKFADSLAFLHSVLWILLVLRIHRFSKCPSQVRHTKLNHFMDHLVADVLRCLFALRAMLAHQHGRKNCTDIYKCLHLFSFLYRLFKDTCLFKDTLTVCYLNCHGTCNPSNVGLCYIYDLHLQYFPPAPEHFHGSYPVASKSHLHHLFLTE